jgi:hypothetical protein
MAEETTNETTPPSSDTRTALADKATEIFNTNPGIGYNEAIGQALADFNPERDPAVAETLVKSLLNVPLERPVLRRHQIPDAE